MPLNPYAGQRGIEPRAAGQLHIRTGVGVLTELRAGVFGFREPVKPAAMGKATQPRAARPGRFSGLEETEVEGSKSSARAHGAFVTPPRAVQLSGCARRFEPGHHTAFPPEAA